MSGKCGKIFRDNIVIIWLRAYIWQWWVINLVFRILEKHKLQWQIKLPECNLLFKTKKYKYGKAKRYTCMCDFPSNNNSIRELKLR